MRRRALLGTALTCSAAAIAGCGTTGVDQSSGAAESPAARLEMAPLTDADLPREVLYTVDRERATTADAALLDRILDDGASTKATAPPLPENQHVAYQQGVYELSHEITNETPATRYAVTVDIVTESVVDDQSIAFSDLPDVDQTKFAGRGLADGEPIGIGTTLVYTDAERDESVLVPESDYSYITWADGSEAIWRVDDSTETVLRTYQYTGEQIATAAAYGRQMRDRFQFALEELSEAQQSIVETAITDTRYVVDPDATPPESFTQLTEQFARHEQARGLDEESQEQLNGQYLVEYQASTYWTTLFVRPDTGGTATPE